LFYLIYQISQKINAGLEGLTVIVLAVTLSFSFSTIKRSSKNLPIVSKNLKGEKYYGYTPDWINFLKCSEWCADNLPPSALVASRKAPMSFIYGKGKKFFPIYSVIKRDTATNQSNPDSALVFFKANKVTHVMLGQLRTDPNNPAAGFINTMHNILVPIAQKYPEKLVLVHTEGAFEETQVYEIKY
jgi:predicted lipoprotein with Yx(FWY)xxD motif